MADIKSERRPAWDRNRWPASYWNAWPASSESAAGKLEGALVTIDAMGCQVDIADKIVAHGADYLLALKGNQPTLEEDVESYLATAPAQELVAKTTIEKGHGRIETRTYTASSVVDFLGSDLHRNQFALGKFKAAGGTAPEIWSTVLAA